MEQCRLHGLEVCRLRVDVFPPRASPARGEHTEVEKAGCVLVFHGGGWVKGSPSMVHSQCNWYADNLGMLALAPQYRRCGAEGVSLYDAVADAWDALQWVRPYTHSQHAQRVMNE